MARHGSFLIKRVGRIIVYKAEGIWDVNTVIPFIREFKELAADVKKEEWGAFGDLREWGSVFPQVETELTQLYGWAKEHNGIYEVLVFNSHSRLEEYELQKMVDHGSAQYLTVHELITTDPGEGIAWFRNYGFELKKEDLFISE
ncbi:MAG: hypothetical protein KAU17_14930 [Spirochaetales bacterium]|nr:hypothetical protein [Spirochaetales bacterium]